MEPVLIAALVAGLSGVFAAVGGLVTAVRDRRQARHVWYVEADDAEQATREVAARIQERAQADATSPGVFPTLAGAPHPVRATTATWPTILTAVIAAAGVVAAAFIARGTSPPDCVAYAGELDKLARTHSSLQLSSAVKQLHFDRYEDSCGPAGPILEDLARE